jgi:hypothetical protein
MKKKLNILCVLMLVLMIASIVMAIIGAADDFHRGWEDGRNATEPSAYFGAFGMLIVFICFLVCFYALACFVRFILNVNHGEVFTWANVDLLRTVGWCIIVPTIVMCAIMSPDLENLWDTWGEAFGVVAEGIFILIMAEAFAIGMKLKEEQELTI